MEGNRRVPQARHHNRATLGETGRHARAAAPSRQAWIGVRVPVRTGRLGSFRNLGGATEPEDSGAEAHATGVVAPSPQRVASRARVWTTATAVLVLFIALMGLWARRNTEYFWHNPIVDARFQRITDWDGAEQAAAISRDGRIRRVRVESRRADGCLDLGREDRPPLQPHEPPRGRDRQPGAAHAVVLTRQRARHVLDTASGGTSKKRDRRVGGPRARRRASDVSRRGRRIRLVRRRLAARVPHDGCRRPHLHSNGRTRRKRSTDLHGEGRHSRPFSVWSPDRAFIYFVQGEVLENEFRNADIWRIKPDGGPAERITFHNSRVTHPVFVDDQTLLYLATDPDASGPWLYSLDVNHRIPHRLSSGAETYTSLAASADGHRLVLTSPVPKALCGVCRSTRMPWARSRERQYR